MREKRQMDTERLKSFEDTKRSYQKMAPIFQRLGLKPHRCITNQDEVFFNTADGWFRLSLTKYSKEQLRWLRSILQYLAERGFNNWAVPWQKTIIWEENSFCYLIQPWMFGSEFFNIGDPASIVRFSEVLADFYRCGKDYRENKGIEIGRDSWSNMERVWQSEYEMLDGLNKADDHDKIGKELNDLRKESLAIISDVLNKWKVSGINSLMEHHLRNGLIGHGNLRAQYIVWNQNDYYLLNWEHLAFMPKIVDLASLIRDVSYWESEWIVYFINEFSKILPFWNEEYEALIGLLRYPTEAVNLFKGLEEDGPDKKDIKEVAKQLVRKEKCLDRVWKELGSHKRWAWGRTSSFADDSGKISMVISPVETWGGYSNSIDSLIQVNKEQELPHDIMERLVYREKDRVVGGKDGNILVGTVELEGAGEITEELPSLIVEEITTEADEAESITNAPLDQSLITNEAMEAREEKNVILEEEVKPDLKTVFPGSNLIKTIQWTNFPKPIKAR